MFHALLMCALPFVQSLLVVRPFPFARQGQGWWRFGNRVVACDYDRRVIVVARYSLHGRDNLWLTSAVDYPSAIVVIVGATWLLAIGSFNQVGFGHTLHPLLQQIHFFLILVAHARVCPDTQEKKKHALSDKRLIPRMSAASMRNRK